MHEEEIQIATQVFGKVSGGILRKFGDGPIKLLADEPFDITNDDLDKVHNAAKDLINHGKVKQTGLPEAAKCAEKSIIFLGDVMALETAPSFTHRLIVCAKAVLDIPPATEKDSIKKGAQVLQDAWRLKSEVDKAQALGQTAHERYAADSDGTATASLMKAPDKLPTYRMETAGSPLAAMTNTYQYITTARETLCSIGELDDKEKLDDLSGQGDRVAAHRRWRGGWQTLERRVHGPPAIEALVVLREPVAHVFAPHGFALEGAGGGEGDSGRAGVGALTFSGVLCHSTSEEGANHDAHG